MNELDKWIDTVWEGNCLTLLRQLPPSSVDMILSDLPYEVTQNGWDVMIDLAELWACYLRVAKPNAAIILSGQGAFTGRLITSNPSMFRYKIVWIKSRATNFLNRAIQPLRKHEDMCVFYNEQPVYHPQFQPGKPYNKGVRRPMVQGNYGPTGSSDIKSDGPRYPTDVIFHEESTDFLYIKTCEHENAPVFHPTQKPIDLGRYFIRTYSDPGALILDNCCGSGSYLVAAKMENRHYIGMDLNQGVQMAGKPVDLIQVCKQRLSSVQLLLEL